MNMALAGGKAGGIIANMHSGSSINKFKPIEPINKTQGSVFGALTHGALGRQNPKGPAIGSLLAGNFGSLTPDKTGMASLAQPRGRNDAQDHTKDADEMLKIANNLDMKDMWAAA